MRLVAVLPALAALSAGADLRLAGTLENNGVLLKLVGGSESFDAGSPYFSSAGASETAMRPRLVIAYSSPTGLAR